MSQTVLKLDHEFGNSAKLGFTIPKNEDGEEEKPLLPLPAKYKYRAMLLAIQKLNLDKDQNVSVTIKHGKNVSTAYIDFSSLIKNKEDVKELEKIESDLTLYINSKIQPSLRQIMSEDGLDYKEYFRTDSYFESQRQNNQLIINWKKVDDSESE